MRLNNALNAGEFLLRPLRRLQIAKYNDTTSAGRRQGFRELFFTSLHRGAAGAFLQRLSERVKPGAVRILRRNTINCPGAWYNLVPDAHITDNTDDCLVWLSCVCAENTLRVNARCYARSSRVRAENTQHR